MENSSGELTNALSAYGSDPNKLAAIVPLLTKLVQAVSEQDARIAALEKKLERPQ